MKVSVFDTYVPKGDKVLMHFDILVKDDTTASKVYDYGKEYLNSKNLFDYPLTTKECNFCHIETASEDLEKAINEKGYYIIEMENCG